MAQENAVRLVIAICTYRRPDKLGMLLPLVQKQAMSFNQSCRILVVDNDVHESALPVFKEYSAQTLVPHSYVTEKRVGIGNARNAAFADVNDGESILFFDDDQIPGENWLSAFSEALVTWPDTVLTGPVTPRLPEWSPAWADGAWAWGSREGIDGELKRMAGFGNLLIPSAILSKHNPRVPGPFACGAGEDTVVTLGLYLAGVPIRFVADAKAVEPVESTRLNKSWVLDRSEGEARAWAKVSNFLELPKLRLWLSAGKALAGAVSDIFRGVLVADEKRLLQGRVSFRRFIGYAKYAIRSH